QFALARGGRAADDEEFGVDIICFHRELISLECSKEWGHGKRKGKRGVLMGNECLNRKIDDWGPASRYHHSRTKFRYLRIASKSPRLDVIRRAPCVRAVRAI